jgi:hypothetical protein
VYVRSCQGGRRNQTDRAPLSGRTRERPASAIGRHFAVPAGCERVRKKAASKARSAHAMFAPPICRRNRRNASETGLNLRDDRFVGSDEDGGCSANIAASEASQ